MAKRISVVFLVSLALLVTVSGLFVVCAQDVLVEGPPVNVPRYKANATILDNKLYVISGDEMGYPTEYLDLEEGSEWVVMGEDSPCPAGENAIPVTANGKIFAVCGENEEGINQKIYLFDEEDGEWEALPGEATMGHNDGFATVLDDKIYVLCGESDGITNEAFDYASAVDVYDTNTGRWSTAAPMPNPRQDTCCVTLGKKIYVIGGQGANEGDTPTASVMILDTEANTWEEGPALPYGWEAPRAAVVGGKIYILTGKGEGAYYIYEFDPATGEYREMPSYTNIARYGCGIAAHKDKIYVVSGANMLGDPTPSVEIYTPSLDN